MVRRPRWIPAISCIVGPISSLSWLRLLAMCAVVNCRVVAPSKAMPARSSSVRDATRLEKISHFTMVSRLHSITSEDVVVAPLEFGWPCRQG